MLIRLLYPFFSLLIVFSFLFLYIPKASAWFYLWFSQPTCSISFSPPSPVRVGNPFNINLYSYDSLGLANAALSGSNIPGLPKTWPIPAGYTSAANSFTFYPSSSGVYTVSGTATNTTGNAGTCQASFTVNPPIPSAPYSLSSSCPAPGSTATLSWKGPTDASRYSVRTRLGGSDTYRTVTACNGANCTNQTSFGTNPGTTFDNWGVQSCNDSGCSAETVGSSFSCSPPCNTNIGCSGSCSAASNTCQTNNGTLSNCNYWGYTGGGSCTIAAAPPQPCTTNTCISPKICINPGAGATCQIPPPPAPAGNSVSGSCPAPGTSATLSWSNSAEATSYNVRVTSTTKSAPASPYDFSPLTPGWIYGDPGIPSNSWGVSATNAGGTSSETAGAPFRCVPSSSTPNTPDPNNPNSPNGGFYACSGNTYTGNLTWGGNPYYTDPDGGGAQSYQWGFWVNVKESSDFNDANPSDPYYPKWMPCSDPQNRNTCANSTPIPAGFTFRSNNNTLTLNSSTAYYYRVYNGNTSNPASLSFSKTCPPATPNQTGLSATCPSPGTTANVYWSGASGSSYYLARVGSNTTDTRSNPDPTIPNATVPTTTNTTYSSWGVKACNTGGCSSEALGSSSIECLPYPAFLKTTGGDVHSNR